MLCRARTNFKFGARRAPTFHCSNSVTRRDPRRCVQISGTLFDEPPVRE